MVDHIDMTNLDDPTESDTKTISAMGSSTTEATSASEPPVKRPKIAQPDTKTATGKAERIMDENASFSSLLTPEMVDIYVGPKRKRFHIYRQLICSKASFFNSHFGPIETKQPMTDMYLPDHDPRAFDLFSTFLFQNSFAEIIPPIEGAENQSKTMLDRYATDIDTFLQLYLMARDWHIRNLRNQVLDHLHRYIAKSGASFRPIQVATVWGKIKDPASLLKRFIVDHFVFSVMKKSVSSKVRRSHLINRMNIDSSTFVLDVFDAIIGARKYPTPIDPDTKDLCDYHEHPKGEQCPE